VTAPQRQPALSSAVREKLSEELGITPLPSAFEDAVTAALLAYSRWRAYRAMGQKTDEAIDHFREMMKSMEAALSLPSGAPQWFELIEVYHWMCSAPTLLRAARSVEPPKDAPRVGRPRKYGRDGLRLNVLEAIDEHTDVRVTKSSDSPAARVVAVVLRIADNIDGVKGKRRSLKRTQCPAGRTQEDSDDRRHLRPQEH
jgi:hypothetical protein